MRYLCSRVVQRECVLELPLYFAFPLRGNSYLHHRRFRRRAASSAPLVPYDAIRRIRVGWRSCTVTKPCANRSAVCPVLLRPELHLRRFHRRRCRHIRSACFREFFTCSRVTWPHALRMQALSLPHTSKLRSYRRTTQPSSGPSGSRKSCFLRMLSFSSQPSLWRNVLRLAHCFRASDGTFLDCCDALLFCRRLCRAHKSPALHVAATAPTSLATRSRTLSH